jgi:hypothetical protein
MLNNYGFSGPDWDAAKKEATAILIDVARRKGRIAYSELARQIQAIKIEAHDPRMFHLLGEISIEEDKAGRGMLTAIVVHKSGDMQPGPGFFQLAKALGKDTSDILACWVSEFNRVHDYWANRANRK